MVQRIFYRPCFACGKTMTKISDYTPMLECKDCELTEDGTVNGKFTSVACDYEWYGEFIRFTDHSKFHLPSPDTIGDHEGQEIPVELTVKAADLSS
jgi:hypothetical protein